MKKTMMIILALLSAGVCFAADNSARTASVSGIEFTRKGDAVQVDFDVATSRETVKSDRSLVITPVIKKDGQRCDLAPVVIEGRRAQKAGLLYAVPGGDPKNPIERRANAGGTYHYSATLTFEEWMSGSSLGFDVVEFGCCSATQARELEVAAQDVLYKALPDSVAVVVTTTVEPTTGERLAMQYPFILPMFAAGDPLDERVMADSREESIIIYYAQNKTDIDFSFADNNSSMVKLLSSVRMIQNSNDSKVSHVVIAGFASPEGSLAVNSKLAQERAANIKAYLMQNTSVDRTRISVYNGEVDWWLLRELVSKSDMPSKQQVLDIIDNAPVWDAQKKQGRQGLLMKLDAGKPYRYMFTNFFPQMRNSTYIRVYYENK